MRLQRRASASGLQWSRHLNCKPGRMAQLRRQVVRDFMEALDTGNYDNWHKSVAALREALQNERETETNRRPAADRRR